MNSKFLGAIAVSLGLGLAQTGDAAVLYAFEEQGGDVVGTLSGSLVTTGVIGSALGKAGIGINPELGILLSGPNSAPSFPQTHGVVFRDIFTATTFGAGGPTSTDRTSGHMFAIGGPDLLLPPGWVSGSSLSGSLTFLGQTFASMGITEGSYVYSLPNDTITLRFGETAAAIPLPPALPMLGAGVFALGWVARRRHRTPQRT